MQRTYVRTKLNRTLPISARSTLQDRIHSRISLGLWVCFSPRQSGSTLTFFLTKESQCSSHIFKKKKKIEPNHRAAIYREAPIAEDKRRRASQRVDQNTAVSSNATTFLRQSSSIRVSWQPVRLLHTCIIAIIITHVDTIVALHRRTATPVCNLLIEPFSSPLWDKNGLIATFPRRQPNGPVDLQLLVCRPWVFLDYYSRTNVQYKTRTDFQGLQDRILERLRLFPSF
jgi:hypothetical protein